ncbi:MAG: alpha/beta hydrolase [Chloroflexi bacterium]|nr:alpha/beta hydrolase [Chloroflexota bacterium]
MARSHRPFSADRRFSFDLYVPEQPTGTICVYIHGTERDAAGYCDALTPLADACGCIILSPLFPAGLIEPNDTDNYKNIRFHNLRFDRLLLGMIAEVARQFQADGRCFLLGGFSGGAQFAHRFYYLHPDRLLALSVAAPGRVTLPDDGQDWWLGVRDMEAQFGQPLRLAAMRRVPVHLAVGADDTADVTLDAASPYWMPGVERIGSTRVERLRHLHASLSAHGISAALEIVSGVAHEASPLIARSAAFFATILREHHDESTTCRL